MKTLRQLFTKDFWKGVALLSSNSIIEIVGFIVRWKYSVLFTVIWITIAIFYEKSNADPSDIPEDSTVIPAVIKNRIVVESEFRWPDPALSEGKESSAAILRDTVSGDCFLYLWSGMSSGGAAISNIECDNNPSILVPQFIIEGTL